MFKNNLIVWGLLYITSSFSFAQISENQYNTLTFPSQKLKTSERMIAFATEFLDKPYIGATLETEGPEQLVVRFDGFDCSTLVETCLALAIAKNKNYKDFTEKLQTLRYRNGKLAGYGSRLHYLTEWLIDTENKKFVSLLPTDVDGTLLVKEVNFMSKNWDKYPRANTPSIKKEIKEAEKRINSREIFYWPKLNLDYSKIKHGDIVAITTSKAGLDCAHQGIAIRKGNSLHLLHASFEKKKVIIATETLQNYMKRVKSHHGIIIARINE